MLRNFITIYFLLAIITSDSTCTKDVAAKKKAQQMEIFMRDLYSANNLNDLAKYGGKESN